MSKTLVKIITHIQKRMVTFKKLDKNPSKSHQKSVNPSKIPVKSHQKSVNPSKIPVNPIKNHQIQANPIKNHH